MFGVTVGNEEWTMQFESNVEFIEDLFAAFGRGDIGYVIDAHAEGVVSESPVSRTSTLPWAGTRTGRRELVEYLEAVVGTCDPRRSTMSVLPPRSNGLGC